MRAARLEHQQQPDQRQRRGQGQATENVAMRRRRAGDFKRPVVQRPAERKILVIAGRRAMAPDDPIEGIAQLERPVRQVGGLGRERGEKDRENLLAAQGDAVFKTRGAGAAAAAFEVIFAGNMREPAVELVALAQQIRHVGQGAQLFLPHFRHGQRVFRREGSAVALALQHQQVEIIAVDHLPQPRGRIDGVGLGQFDIGPGYRGQAGHRPRADLADAIGDLGRLPLGALAQHDEIRVEPLRADQRHKQKGQREQGRLPRRRRPFFLRAT